MEKKILIIDDEIGKKGSSIQVISQRLKNNGYKIIPCKSFDYVGQIKPLIIDNYRELRLVICDLLDKKEINGWSVIENIKHEQNKIEENKWFTTYLPIVVVTQAEEQDYQGMRHTYRKQHVTLFGKPVSDVFYGCVDVLIDLFDALCQEKMEFKVAISYTWNNKQTNDNHQPFIERIAHGLYRVYKKNRVFYDKEKISITGGSLADELSRKIYGKGSDFVLVFLSNDYATTSWTETEWKYIKNRADKNCLLVSIESLDKYAVANHLFPDEWNDEHFKNDNSTNDNARKDAFIAKYMPLYYDCSEVKRKFDLCLKNNSLDVYFEQLEPIDKIIDEIVTNISNRNH